MKKFLTGFNSVFVGLNILAKDRSVLMVALLPLAVNVIVAATVAVLGFKYVPDWVEKVKKLTVHDSPGFWDSILSVPLEFLTWITFIGLLFFVTYIVAMILASPLNGLLAEKALQYMGVVQPKPFSFLQWLATSARMVWISLIKSILFAGIGVLVFFVSFVPVLGIFSSIVVLLIISFDGADYSFEVLQFNLIQRLTLFRENWPYFLGAATVIGLTLMVPILNFVLFPAIVVGQADLVRRILNN